MHEKKFAHTLYLFLCGGIEFLWTNAVIFCWPCSLSHSTCFVFSDTYICEKGGNFFHFYTYTFNLYIKYFFRVLESLKRCEMCLKWIVNRGVECRRDLDSVMIKTGALLVFMILTNFLNNSTQNLKVLKSLVF